MVSTDFLIHGDDFAAAVALQPDGRIIVVGEVGAQFTPSPNQDTDTAFGIARYNTDGSLDTSFDGDGLVTTDFGSTHDSASAVAVQSDGKIVVAGSNISDFACDFVLARYNSNGSLDSAGFGSGGKVTTDFAGDFDTASAMVIQSDGKIVVAGSASGNFGLARYNSNGTLDTAGFGTGGKVTTDFFAVSGATDLIIQPDGKLLAAGGANNDFALARYNSNGTLDTTGFGSGGKVTTHLGGFDFISGLALQKDGGILAAGRFFPKEGNGKPAAFFALARYTAGGNLDPSFGTSGIVTADFFSVDNRAAAVALQNDGRIIVGGFADTGSSNDFALVRYTLIPSQLLNIATRLRVQTGENVLIGGFIITGTDPKKVIIRGIGPSLSAFFNGALANPTLELYQGTTLLDTNDDWIERRAEIEATGIPPSNDLEAAIVRTLAPGNYTAIVRGKGDGTGIGVVEAYDLDQAANSKLANIATRGFVDTDNNVMIGGLILGPNGAGSTKVVVRAIGPTLANFQINGALQDPTLDLVNSSGVVVRANNDWKLSQRAEIEALGLQPGDDRESALVETLAPGNYTAIVRGNGNTTGVGLVEVYNVQ